MDGGEVLNGSVGGAEVAARIAALAELAILDTPPEPAFDEIVRAAAASLGTPMALVSLLDRDRQWFKAKLGVDQIEGPLKLSFCAHAVASEGVFCVPDAASDERFTNNPAVTGDMHLRFYAGVPLQTSAGVRIGVLCVLGNAARSIITPDEAAKLEALASEIVRLIEERRG